MIDYDINQPLISIHIPKTAGVSVREIYRTWFGEGLLFHYYNNQVGTMPEKYDLAGMHSREKPVLLHGHFNRMRKFGIEHYYPEARQFITILRDPFEKVVSGYFFVRKKSGAWRDKSRVPKADLRDFLLAHKMSMLEHFPRQVTEENYQEMIEKQFVEIGIMEHLDESMKRIAEKLNCSYDPASLEHMNTTARNQRVPYELKEEFIENHPLDYAVYNYVLRKFT